MTPDDSRHGTSAGYTAGCREWCCWQAKQRYDKRRRWEARQGLVRRLPAVGSVRRLQALRALGWSVSHMADHMGVTTSQIHDYGRYPTVYTATHRAIADMYELLADREPPQTTTSERHAYTKTRRTAERHGWPTPDRWFDIDDPDEQPDPGYVAGSRQHDDVDLVVVDRILAGDATLARSATKAEKIEVVRRWQRAGRALKELARLTGWEPHRYLQKEAA